MYADGALDQEDYLLLSGLQHFVFCPRQWALIHLEGQWAENLKTVEGELLHSRAHDAKANESRGDKFVLRDLRVASNKMGLSGACDVVEFHRDEKGIPLQGREGNWRVYPVEYKRGKPKEHRADEIQLCAQGMCLEEMLCCEIPEGSLFYGETRRRQVVEFDAALRELVENAAAEMHRLAQRGYTPKVKPRKGCANCSLRDLCLPTLSKKKSVKKWVEERIGEESQ